MSNGFFMLVGGNPAWQPRDPDEIGKVPFRAVHRGGYHGKTMENARCSCGKAFHRTNGKRMCSVHCAGLARASNR